jgi:hypothetical protein
VDHLIRHAEQVAKLKPQLKRPLPLKPENVAGRVYALQEHLLF